MKYIQALKGFHVFPKGSKSEIDLVVTLEDGTRQVPTIDINKPITPSECLRLIEKSEERSGVEVGSIEIWVSLWEYEDKKEYLEANKSGFIDDLNPWNTLRDEYVFTKSDSLLWLTRSHGCDAPTAYEWIDGGFRQVDYFHNPVGDIINPTDSYKEVASDI